MQFIGVSKHEPLYASCKEGIIRRNETTDRAVVKGKTERLARPLTSAMSRDAEPLSRFPSP